MGRVTIGIGALLVGAAACSSGATETGTGTGTGTGGRPSGEVCTDDPFVCAKGETCGFADVDGSRFECFASGEGAIGEACTNKVGEPVCGDGLFCVQTSQAEGTCTPFCDVAHGCPDGIACVEVKTPAGVGARVCDPAAVAQTEG
jgi:hypothetical protein